MNPTKKKTASADRNARKKCFSHYGDYCVFCDRKAQAWMHALGRKTEYGAAVKYLLCGSYPGCNDCHGRLDNTGRKWFERIDWIRNNVHPAHRGKVERQLFILETVIKERQRVSA